MTSTQRLHSYISPHWCETILYRSDGAPLLLQVMVLKSYDTMLAQARRQEEGSLIFILDKADLYLRVRHGLRQVMVTLLVWCTNRCSHRPPFLYYLCIDYSAACCLFLSLGKGLPELVNLSNRKKEI